MKREEFERIAQEVFDGLPKHLLERIDNVRIVVEAAPSAETMHQVALAPSSMLLGLYEGVPLTKRGVDYGVAPVVPDKITLYQRNIELSCSSEKEISEKIKEVLIHEIGHYFGMNEREIREAGY